MGLKQMEVTEKAIGDYMFYLRPFPAFKAANISGDIAALVLPVVGALLPLFTQEGEIKDEEAMPALASGLSSLTGDQVERLVKKLIIDQNNVSVEGEATGGKPKILNMDLANEIFCGDVWGMYSLCWEVLKLNFGGFFGKLRDSRFGSLLESTAAAQK